MFKIKQKVIFDDNFNVIKLEEYQDDELMYWEERNYNGLNSLLKTKSSEGEFHYHEYPHKIYFVPNCVIKHINIDFKINGDNLIFD